MLAGVQQKSFGTEWGQFDFLSNREKSESQQFALIEERKQAAPVDEPKPAVKTQYSEEDKQRVMQLMSSYTNGHNTSNKAVSYYQIVLREEGRDISLKIIREIIESITEKKKQEKQWVFSVMPEKEHMWTAAEKVVLNNVIEQKKLLKRKREIKPKEYHTIAQQIITQYEMDITEDEVATKLFNLVCLFRELWK